SYFSFHLTSTPAIYPLSLHDALPIYGYAAARHPMVGNPCSHTVFDPTKITNLPGNVWVRGAIVQGSDLRPPLGIEVKIEGKDIRSEEHTSELQSRGHLVCRLLLEKKK